jgi:hypothetical protein
MFNTRILATVFAAVVAMPLLANASTINPVNDIVNGGKYDMFGPHFFAEAFGNADGAGIRQFTFKNSDTVRQNLILTTATVNALATMFTGGVTFEWLKSGRSLFASEAETNFSGQLNNTIRAGKSDTLRVTYGDPERRTDASASGNGHFSLAFDSSPATVPLPAGGLLLMAALGGIAVLRRRRNPAV